MIRARKGPIIALATGRQGESRKVAADVIYTAEDAGPADCESDPGDSGCAELFAYHKSPLRAACDVGVSVGAVGGQCRYAGCPRRRHALMEVTSNSGPCAPRPPCRPGRRASTLRDNFARSAHDNSTFDTPGSSGMNTSVPWTKPLLRHQNVREEPRPRCSGISGAE